jgi:SAM-dependent methyltransferase
MNGVDTDGEWERWGAQDPYFGVITNPEFRRENLGEVEKQRFFASGHDQAEHVIRVCREKIDSSFMPRRVLDFGCGVGRVTLALAAVAETVVGLDVSESMLREAENNRIDHSITNVIFVKSDDDLSSLPGSFDLIHSFIVFQHLEVHRGRQMFAKLIDRLAPGGLFAAHFTYGKARHAASFGRPPPTELAPLHVNPDDVQRDPVMLMNPYDVNELLFVMQLAGVKKFFTEFTDHGGELGVFLYFQK